MRARSVPILLVAITVMAALLRLVEIARIPPGLFFDVAANLFDVLDVLNGARPIWFTRNNGREPMMLYATAAAALAFGPTALAAKVTAALFGIATIPATYLFGREAGAGLGDGPARTVGLLAAFLTATMYWHLHFSRLGLRTIVLPLFLALGLGLLLAAARRQSLVWAALAGLAFGAATYTYTSVRLLPLAALPFMALVARRSPRVAVVAFALWVLVSVPLGVYYAGHPEEVQGRSAAVSVLNPEVSGGDPVRAALRGLRATALATVWSGSESGLENLPERPLFEPLTAVAFLLGLAVAALSLLRAQPVDRASSLLLLATLGAMALSPALSVNPPGFVRISGMVPPALVLAALGYWQLGQWLRPFVRRGWPGVAALALAVPLVWTGYDYFVRWYGSGLAYRWVMEDKVQASDRVHGWLEGGERVFLAPLYARDYTFQYLLRDRPPESFDVGAGLLLPAAGPARYAFPPEDRDGLATVAARLGEPARFEMVADDSGERPLLATLVVDQLSAPVGPALASFDRGIALLRAELDRSAVRPGDVLHLALTWRAERPVERDYTVFMHGRLGNANRFQRDRMPADGSLPTGRWRPGDLIGDYYRLELPRDLPPGQYRVVVGLYEPTSGERLIARTAAGESNEVEVGRLAVGP